MQKKNLPILRRSKVSGSTGIRSRMNNLQYSSKKAITLLLLSAPPAQKTIRARNLKCFDPLPLYSKSQRFRLTFAITTTGGTTFPAQIGVIPRDLKAQ